MGGSSANSVPMADNPALHFRALLDLRLNSDSGLLKCDGFLAVAVDRIAKRLTVIGIDRDPSRARLIET